MHLDRRFAVVVGSSLVWALLVSGVFYRLASGGARSGSSGPLKAMVVAARPLPVGAMLDAESVKVVRVPEKFFPKGAFSVPEEVLGRGVISPMEPDEAIASARISAKGSGVGLAGMIPSGMRAISVRVNDVVGVAGFVLPGMRVDVLVTGRPSGRDEMVTATVLQNIAVISAGQTIQVDAKSQPINTPVVTLLVTPAQAEALTLANNEGKIQLVLRNSTDHGTAQTAGREARELYGLERPAAPRAAPAEPAAVPKRRAVEPARRAPVAPATVRVPAPETYEMVMIRGNKKTVETLAPLSANSK